MRNFIVTINFYYGPRVFEPYTDQWSNVLRYEDRQGFLHLYFGDGSSERSFNHDSIASYFVHPTTTTTAGDDRANLPA